MAPFVTERPRRLPDAGDVALNAGAQFQVTAQRPQSGGDGGDLIADSLAVPATPAQAVQRPPPVGQGVDLSLQCVVLHGKLLRRLDAVAVEV